MPECGYYFTRAGQGKPVVPVRIEIGKREIHPETGELEEPEEMVAIVGLDERADPVKIWLSLTPITREHYDRIVERVRTDPRMAATNVKIDLSAKPTRPR